MISAHPLTWPEGWKRTPSHGRKTARFTSLAKRLTIAEGVGRVLAELDRLGFTRDDIVISTNVRVRLDGLPRSDQSEPGDPGVAVYWQKPDGSNQRVIAVDAYDTVAGNLGAIAATLDAMRAIERHGGAQILERAFTGFTALPPPTQTAWRELFGFNAAQHVTREALGLAYQRERSKAHPDKGGTSEAFQRVQEAYEQACKEIGS